MEAHCGGSWRCCCLIDRGRALPKSTWRSVRGGEGGLQGVRGLQGFACRVWGLGFGVQGLGSRVRGSGLGDQVGFRVDGLGFRGSGFRVPKP